MKERKPLSIRHTALVWVEGRPDCIALSHVEVTGEGFRAGYWLCNDGIWVWKGPAYFARREQVVENDESLTVEQREVVSEILNSLGK